MAHLDACLVACWSRTRAEREWLSAVREQHLTDWCVGLTTGRHTWAPSVGLILDAPPGHTPTVEDGIGMYVPESRLLLATAFAAAVADGTPYDLDLWVQTFAGQIKRVRSRGVPMRVGGVVVAVAGSFTE